MSDIITKNYEVTQINGLPLPSRGTRKAIVGVTIVCCWFLIGYLMVNGSSENSLHQSALSWAFTLMASTIFAYVFGAVIDNFNLWRNTRSTENK